MFGGRTVVEGRVAVAAAVVEVGWVATVFEGAGCVAVAVAAATVAVALPVVAVAVTGVFVAAGWVAVAATVLVLVGAVELLTITLPCIDGWMLQW